MLLDPVMLPGPQILLFTCEALVGTPAPPAPAALILAPARLVLEPIGGYCESLQARAGR